MKKVKVLLIVLMLFTAVAVAACDAGTVVVRFDLSMDLTRAVSSPMEDFYLEKTIDKGTALEKPQSIWVEDSYVSGWFSNKEFTEEWDFSKPVNCNMTLYAKWSTDFCEVKLNFNNGDNPTTIKVGKSSAFLLPVPQKPHRTFEGWYLDEEFTTEFSAEGAGITESVKLFAKWSAEKYNITLQYNNGNTPTVLAVQGDKVPKIPTPQKQFYTFEGWYLDETLETKLTDTYVVADDLTLYADWKLFMMERQSSFPAVVIDTKDEEKILEKEKWIDAKVAITNTIEEYTITADGFNAEIRGRGNNTWTLPKKPYRIKFGKKTSVLGSDYKAKNWTLLANHNDKSMMRNHLAYNFANSLENMEFAPTAIFVDVYLNGEYNGVYTLSDQMEAGEGRVDIDTTIHENPADCDYLFELDGYAAHEPGAVEDRDYVVVAGRGFTIKSPKTDGEGWTSAHALYLKQYIQKFYNVVRGNDYSKIEEMIDVPSFVDCLMVYEFFKNRDYDNWSAYLYLEDGKLHAGPIWDFDWSSGDCEVTKDSTGSRFVNGMFYSYPLMQHDEFYSRFVARWNEVAQTKIDLVFHNLLDTSINHGYSILNNYEIWDITDTSYLVFNIPEYTSIETFNGHVEYLKNWLLDRVDWMNEFYGENDTWAGG